MNLKLTTIPNFLTSGQTLCEALIKAINFGKYLSSKFHITEHTEVCISKSQICNIDENFITLIYYKCCKMDIQEIDGSVLEGGGQILRMSISLSAVLNIPVRVKNIRAGRQKPGLAAQHLKGIQLVAEMCQAQLKGAYIGSTEIEFIPGKMRGGHYVADTKTAGSISLLLQVALPCALFASGPVVLELKGGTNAAMAPQIDYMDWVFRQNLNLFGADFSMETLKRGYYPRGGGHVRVHVSPVKGLRGVSLLERGELQDIRGVSFVVGDLPFKLADDIAESARAELTSKYKANIKSFKDERSMAKDNCSGIVLCSSWSNGCALGASGLGGRGELAGGAVGRAAGRQLKDLLQSEVCLDDHSQDQLIVYMCLADYSCVRTGALSLHTRTAIHVAETLTGVKFKITSQGDENIIECDGIEFKNKYMYKE